LLTVMTVLFYFLIIIGVTMIGVGAFLGGSVGATLVVIGVGMISAGAIIGPQKNARTIVRWVTRTSIGVVVISHLAPNRGRLLTSNWETILEIDDFVNSYVMSDFHDALTNAQSTEELYATLRWQGRTAAQIICCVLFESDRPDAVLHNHQAIQDAVVRNMKVILDAEVVVAHLSRTMNDATAIMTDENEPRALAILTPDFISRALQEVCVDNRLNLPDGSNPNDPLTHLMGSDRARSISGTGPDLVRPNSPISSNSTGLGNLTDSNRTAPAGSLNDRYEPETFIMMYPNVTELMNQFNQYFTGTNFNNHAFQAALLNKDNQYARITMDLINQCLTRAFLQIDTALEAQFSLMRRSNQYRTGSISGSDSDLVRPNSQINSNRTALIGRNDPN
jgi:hypothetical protein